MRPCRILEQVSGPRHPHQRRSVLTALDVVPNSDTSTSATDTSEARHATELLLDRRLDEEGRLADSEPGITDQVLLDPGHPR